MRINREGLDLIRKFEGFRGTAYVCPAGIWTIGYGHTKKVKPGQRVTETEADALLLADVAAAEDAVKKFVCVGLNENQFSALVSFVFNVGAGNFKNSTLLRLLNYGKYDLVPEQFRRWVYVGKEKSRGLQRRREAEADLWDRQDGGRDETGRQKNSASAESA